MVWAVAVAGLKRSPAVSEGECGYSILHASEGWGTDAPPRLSSSPTHCFVIHGAPPQPRTSADSVTHPTKEASECRRGNGSDRRNTEVSTGR